MLNLLKMNIKRLKYIFDIFYPLVIIILLLLFKYISFSNVICGYIIYCTIVHFTSNGYLFYTKTKFNNELIKSCPHIRNPDFKAYFILPFTFFQFIIIRYSNKNKKMKEIIFKEEKVDDEGTTIIWASYNNDPNIHSKPILLILPGITGKTSDFYVKNIVVEGLDNNFDIVIYQMRTLSHKMKMPQNNKYVDFIEDINNSIKVIKKVNNNKLYAIGYSFGANNLTRYLGTKNVETHFIEGAISVSNPFDMIYSQRVGEESLYEQIMLHFEKKNYIPAALSINKLRNNYIDINCLKSTFYAKDFEIEFLGKILGYKSIGKYYRGISSFENVENINIPFLVINSKDDPFSSFKGVPLDEFRENKNIIFIATDQGAHSCYIENKSYFSLGTKQWILKPIIEFLNYLRNNEFKK